MARLPRLELAGVPQHVIQRGHDRKPCFLEDRDRSQYLAILHRMASLYGCAVHAFVLMSNHVHLLATPNVVGAVSRMMQGIGRIYVPEFNRRNDRTGTLWEGRYKACLVDTETYVLACYRYIELNPVRAAIVDKPSAYRWSSHCANAGAQLSTLVRPHDAYLDLGATPLARSQAYRALFRDEVPIQVVDDIRGHTQQQRALGTDRFRQMLEDRLGHCGAARPVHRRAPTQ